MTKGNMVYPSVEYYSAMKRKEIAKYPDHG